MYRLSFWPAPHGYAFHVPVRLGPRGGAGRVIVTDDDFETPKDPDVALIRLLRHARDWSSRLGPGKAHSAADIACTEGLGRSCVSRIVRLAFLAPEVVEAILDGHQPPHRNAEPLVRCSRPPPAWDDQRRLLGIGRA